MRELTDLPQAGRGDEINPLPPGHDEPIDTKTARYDQDHNWAHLSSEGAEQ